TASVRYNHEMAVPATSRIVRAFEDRADALAHFFQRAGEAPRLIAYDDAVGLPLDQALAALEWTAQVGILAPDDLVHAARRAPELRHIRRWTQALFAEPAVGRSTQLLAGWFATSGAGFLFVPADSEEPFAYCEVAIEG